MYNRYLEQPGGPPPREAVPPPGKHRETGAPRPPKGLGELTGGLGDALGGLLDHLSLGSLDTGDILLVLIILLIFLEGDELETAITLGLMLLLGLGE